MIYTEGHVGPISQESPSFLTDDDDNVWRRKSLDSRYNIVQIMFQPRDDYRNRLILMKNGWLSYPSCITMDQKWLEVPIIFITENARFRHQLCAINESDDNSYCLQRYEWDRIETRVEVDLSSSTSYEASILDGQMQLRQIIRAMTANEIDWNSLGHDGGLIDMAIRGSRLQNLLLVTGEASSGKSEIATHIENTCEGWKRINVKSALGEIIELIGDAYDFNSTEQAAIIFHHIEDLCMANPLATGIVLDHIDDFEAANRLKEILHMLTFRIIYVRADRAVRVARETLHHSQFYAESIMPVLDTLMVQRGCSKFSSIADVLVDNTGALEDVLAFVQTRISSI
ncbi:hypothetical protein EIP86_007764 [Pleurotus ostreatoroseus]|nr:hypothetical protein EIP86_007764 [Pleurotus ostreatoroseus]